MMQLTIPLPECQQSVRLPAGTLQWSEDEFFDFCQANRDLRIERSAKGEIIVMPPAGGYLGYQSGEVFSQLKMWTRKDGTGVAFDSSTGFRLLNGGMRAPDADAGPRFTSDHEWRSRASRLHASTRVCLEPSGLARAHFRHKHSVDFVRRPAPACYTEDGEGYPPLNALLEATDEKVPDAIIGDHRFPARSACREENGSKRNYGRRHNPG
jgi:hypothetical protein